jgi:hypothetical protein
MGKAKATAGKQKIAQEEEKPKSDFDQWKDKARASTDEELRSTVPLHVLFGEAVDVANFFTEFWPAQKEGDKVVRRGLEMAVNPNASPDRKLSADTGKEILSLQRAGQEAHTRWLLVVKMNEDVTSRGWVVLDEITDTLEFMFDDGVEDENDKRLATLSTTHAEMPNTADALANALSDYAFLAEPHRAVMDGLGGFDAKMIDEAKQLAEKLRNRPPSAAEASVESREALVLRNKIVNLMSGRMNLVRSAAKFVFRGQPAIIKKATSAYERRRRAEAARAKKKAEENAPKTDG